MCILITFSISILEIYLLQGCKHLIFNTNYPKGLKLTISLIMMVSSICGIYYLNQILTIDYGFWGCMVAVFVSVFDFRGVNVSKKLEVLDNGWMRLLLLAISLLFVSMDLGGVQYYSLLSVLILCFYSGKKGKYNLKYFFYIFYPTHLVLLYGISMLI